ncbi:hypothetical protein C8R41DRAFT_871518, partial [Lentinula lateritia]
DLGDDVDTYVRGGWNGSGWIVPSMRYIRSKTRRGLSAFAVLQEKFHEQASYRTLVMDGLGESAQALRVRAGSTLPTSAAEKTTRRLNSVCDIIEITDSSDDDDKCSVIEITDSSDDEEVPTKKHFHKVKPQKQSAPTLLGKKDFHKKTFHIVRRRKQSTPTPKDEVRLNPPKAGQLIRPQAEGKTLSAILAQVLELVPDVRPQFAKDLIRLHSTSGQNQVVEAVIHSLFETTSGRRVEKRKSTGQGRLEGGEHKKPRLSEVDYSREHLLVDFPDVPRNYITKTLFAHRVLYAPTHLFLRDENRRGPPFNYIPERPIHASSLKGKGRALEDAEFQRERAWLLEKLKDEDVKLDRTTAEQLDHQGSIETKWCNARKRISSARDSGCNLAFPVSVLQKVLPNNLLKLYERVRQRNEIEMAGLEGLEECPFCDFKIIALKAVKVVYPFPVPILGVLTFFSTELEKENMLESRALMRNCPRCNKAFVKDEGCTIPGGPQSSSSTQKCPLWELLENRHTEEVNAAAEKAMNDYQRVNPGVQIKLHLAKKPGVPIGGANPLGYGLPGMPRNNPYVCYANLPVLYGHNEQLEAQEVTDGFWWLGQLANYFPVQFIGVIWNILSEAWEGFYGLHATLMKTRHSENPKENRAWFLNNVPPHWGLL